MSYVSYLSLLLRLLSHSDKSDTAQATDVEGLYVEVAATEAEKCDRCWHHTPDVGTIEGHEKICGRCVEHRRWRRSA